VTGGVVPGGGAGPDVGTPDASGRAHAISLLTPLKPYGVPWLRVQFAVTRIWPKLAGIAPLTSLYFSRWSLLTRLPSGDPATAGPRPEHPYLVWETDYSAPREPYVESFVHSIGTQINLLWKSSYGFPGTRSVAALAGYLGDHTVPGAYFWFAYPAASVRMVLSALAVAREHRFLAQAAETADPREFAVLYRGFLRRRQRDL
jgi:hypothetical protein